MWVSASMHHALSGPHRAPVKMQFTAPGYYGATLFRTRSHEQLMPVEFCSGDRIQSLLWPPHEAATSLLSNTWGHFPHPDQGGAPKHLENPGKTPPTPQDSLFSLLPLEDLLLLDERNNPCFPRKPNCQTTPKKHLEIGRDWRAGEREPTSVLEKSPHSVARENGEAQKQLGKT